jgi:hypothetical protein
MCDVISEVLYSEWVPLIKAMLMYMNFSPRTNINKYNENESHCLNLHNHLAICLAHASFGTEPSYLVDKV